MRDRRDRNAAQYRPVTAFRRESKCLRDHSLSVRLIRSHSFLRRSLSRQMK